MNYKTIPLVLSVAAATLLVACSKADGGAADQKNDAVNAAQDAASTAVGAAAATMGAATTDGFVTNAGVSGMYEVQAADIALQRTNNSQIKAIAQTIKDDHTRAGAELKSIVAASAPGVVVPAALDQRHQGLIDNLRGASNADFDRVYLEQQNAAHMEAVGLFGGYADGGDNAALKAFAAKTKPALAAHLEMVRSAQGT